MDINISIRVYEPLHKACSLSVSHAAVEKKNENIKASPLPPLKMFLASKRNLVLGKFSLKMLLQLFLDWPPQNASEDKTGP